MGKLVLSFGDQDSSAGLPTNGKISIFIKSERDRERGRDRDRARERDILEQG